MIALLLANVVLTALLSAAVTWGLAYGFYRRRVAAELQRALVDIQAEFEQRVRNGVHAAGVELMPQLREQIRLGFQDALRQSQTGEMVENYATVVNRGTDLIANRLSQLFRVPPKK